MEQLVELYIPKEDAPRALKMTAEISAQTNARQEELFWDDMFSVNSEQLMAGEVTSYRDLASSSWTGLDHHDDELLVGLYWPYTRREVRRNRTPRRVDMHRVSTLRLVRLRTAKPSIEHVFEGKLIYDNCETVASVGI